MKKEWKAPIWLRYICGGFSFLAGIVWIIQIWKMIVQYGLPPINVIFVMCVSIPIGCGLLGCIAVKGKLSPMGKEGKFLSIYRWISGIVAVFSWIGILLFIMKIIGREHVLPLMDGVSLVSMFFIASLTTSIAVCGKTPFKEKQNQSPGTRGDG